MTATSVSMVTVVPFGALAADLANCWPSRVRLYVTVWMGVENTCGRDGVQRGAQGGGEAGVERSVVCTCW